MPKRINITQQDFEDIRTSGGFYLDKTKFLCELCGDTTNKQYFFARPRRFGKSIMCSVMKNMFLGRKDLFEGLYAYDHRDREDTYPVVYISFASWTTSSDPLEYLGEMGRVFIGDQRYTFRDLVGEQEIDLLLLKVLQHIRQQTGKPSAIIIDEYDKPVLTCLNDPKKAEEMREYFRGFYAPVKDNNDLVRFFRLSGLTKVMKMNIFSVLNNLSDLSLDYRYASLIGFTQEEIETNYAEEIDAIVDKEGTDKLTVLSKIKERYNGFNFGDDEDTLYNPRDINNLMMKQQFKYYRADTGIPSGIKEYVEAKATDLHTLVAKVRTKKLGLQEMDLSLQNLQHIRMETLFFQSGYFTIDETFESVYLLKFPNKQADVVFTKFFVELAKPTTNIFERNMIANTFYEGLFATNEEQMQQALQKLFYEQLADTPGEWTSKNPEGWCKSFIGAMLRLSTVYRWGEVNGLGVRADLLIVDKKDPDHCRIVEAKVDESPQVAIKQIEQKYLKTVSTKFAKISKIGINWNRSEEEMEVVLIE